MNKYASIAITAILVAAIGYMLMQQPSQSGTPTEKNGSEPGISTIAPSENVTVKDGVQYITITAKGGYSPQTTFAKGGMPTTIIMKTNGTYDCSSALVIRAANYRGNLPTTGETPINLATPKSGETVQATCSMGMYSFDMRFN